MRVELNNERLKLVAETMEENEILSRGTEFEFSAITQSHGAWSWIFMKPEKDPMD
jgi:hypothetical protein